MKKHLLTLNFLIILMFPMSAVSSNSLKFAIVPKYYSVFFDESGKGCKAAAAQLEAVECIYRGPEKGDVRVQDAIIEQLIDEGVDGIAIAVTQSNFLAKSSIQKAIKAGIPIITYDSDFDAVTLQKYSNIRLAYIGTDNFELGKAFGEQLKKLRPEGGTLLIQTGRPDSPNLNLRIMGLRSALSGKNYSMPPGKILKNEQGWTEVREPIQNYDQIGRSVKQLESFLIAGENHADSFVAVGGWAQNDDKNYRQMIEPYKGTLKNNEIVIIISDTSDIQLKMLRDRLAHVNVGQNPYEMGVQSLITLHNIIQNQKYEKKIYTPLTYCTVNNYDTCTN